MRPRPYTGAAPQFLRASSSSDSLRVAALEGTPLLLGLKPVAEIARSIASYRAIRAELGVPGAEIDREVAAFRVLRRIGLGDTDDAARAAVLRALDWEGETARRVHEGGRTPAAPTTLADGSHPEESGSIPGGCVGTPATVREGLLELHTLGIRHVIAWLNFGDMPLPSVRRSMQLLSRDVLPALRAQATPDLVAGG